MNTLARLTDNAVSRQVGFIHSEVSSGEIQPVYDVELMMM